MQIYINLTVYFFIKMPSWTTLSVITCLTWHQCETTPQCETTLQYGTTVLLLTPPTPCLPPTLSPLQLHWHQLNWITTYHYRIWIEKTLCLPTIHPLHHTMTHLGVTSQVRVCLIHSSCASFLDFRHSLCALLI